MEQWAKAIGDVKCELQRLDTLNTAQAVHFADILLQNYELGKVITSMDKGVALRDKYMTDNVYWILEQEEARGHHRIFITAHNGHIE